MKVRTLFTLAAVSLGLASTSNAQNGPTVYAVAKPAPAVGNQQLADLIKQRLVNTGVAEGASINISTKNGVVELVGEIRNHKQGEMIVLHAMSIPGVSKVDTSLKVIPVDEIQRTTGAEPPVATLPPSNSAPPEGAPGGGAPMGIPPQAFNGEPVPLASPTQPGYDMSGPKLPPYAWPTYAPYPNYSRVAYPQAYPYNAFPFIGPFYPFPKVPLGWRSVKLEWDDGHWYLGRLSTPHDYWRIRYW